MRKNFSREKLNAAMTGISIALMLLGLTVIALSQDKEGEKYFFWSLFTRGKHQGNLQVQSEATSFVLSGGSYNLVLARPGNSALRYTFTLDQVPGEYYIINDWKSYPEKAIITVRVNGTVLKSFTIGCATYISQSLEISHLLRPGANTVEMTLLEGSQQLWMRGTIFAGNSSLARNLELIPNLFPVYAKTFALVFLVLGLLYLVWFFFNRALYRNMDTYSASFALIGIMLACLGVAYCFILPVTRMIQTSMVFLAFTIMLALAAMWSVKKTDSRIRQGAPVEGLSKSEEPASGGDFNF